MTDQLTWALPTAAAALSVVTGFVAAAHRAHRRDATAFELVSVFLLPVLTTAVLLVFAFGGDRLSAAAAALIS